MQRLQAELDSLEIELRQLEKEELPSSHFGMLSETQLQLKEIDLLREQMLTVSESEPFKSYEVLQSALKTGEKDDI